MISKIAYVRGQNRKEKCYGIPGKTLCQVSMYFRWCKLGKLLQSIFLPSILFIHLETTQHKNITHNRKCKVICALLELNWDFIFKYFNTLTNSILIFAYIRFRWYTHSVLLYNYHVLSKMYFRCHLILSFWENWHNPIIPTYKNNKNVKYDEFKMNIVRQHMISICR